MAQVEMVNFASITSGSTQTVNLSKITGTPKAVIVFHPGRTTVGSSASVNLGIGLSDGSTDRAITVTDQDATSPTNTNRRHSAKLASVISATPSILEEFSCAFSAGDLDLTYSTTEGFARLYSALVFDCEAAAVVDFALPTSTGEFEVTGAGFRPTSYMVISIGNGNAVPHTQVVAKASIGFANRRDQQCHLSMGTKDNVTTTVTRAGLHNDIVYGGYNNTPSSGLATEVAHVGMTSDGCRMNRLVNNGTAERIFILFFKGIDIGIQTFQQPASTGVQYVTGARPRPQCGVVLGSRNTDLNNANQQNFGATVGFFDNDLIHRCATMHSSNGATASNSSRDRQWHDDEVIAIPNSVDAYSVVAEAAPTSILSDGTVLTWGVADATQRYNALITFGNPETGRRSRATSTTREGCIRYRGLGRLTV
jgi:hypothetical protein